MATMLAWAVVAALPITPAWAVVAAVPTASAQAQSPWWRLTSGSRPTGLAPAGSGELVVTAENVGDANIDGAGPAGPAVITDTLPAGVRAVGVAGAEPGAGTRTAIPCTLLTQSRVSCELTGTLVPYAEVEVRVAVLVEGATSGELNAVSVSGAGAPDARAERPLTIDAQPPAFGVEDYELADEQAGGASDVQAGSHPFQQTTTIALKQTADLASLGETPLVRPVALAKDLSIEWPAGMVGNATVLPRCTPTQFFAIVDGGLENGCPPQSAVGVISLTVYEPATVGFVTYTLPLFNLEPAPGEPARFGFYAIEANTPGFIDTAVRAGGDYGVTVSIENITQTAGFLSGKITLWGTPGDPRHAKQRGWGCLLGARKEAEYSPCIPSSEAHPPALLTLPSSCPRDPATGEPQALLSGVEGDSWSQAKPRPAMPLAQDLLPGLTGCGALGFSAEIQVTPDLAQASRPTGLSVAVQIPQQPDEAQALASSTLADLRVTLPEGVAVNPAAGDALQGCTEGQVGFTTVNQRTGTDEFTPKLPEPLEPGVNFCSDLAKLGTVKIRSPIAASPLEGAVYLAAPNANPFGSLLALYLVATDPVSGTLVKLAGEVTLDQRTGQLTIGFQNTPQLPLEAIELHFFKGERALLTTPAHCGTYTATASLAPWSGNPPAEPSASFQISSGLDAGAGGSGSGSGCPGASLPFAPTLSAGTPVVQAGAFSPLTVTLGREDGQQALQGFALRLPAGLSGMLAAVPLCGEAQANAGTCPAASQIGTTTVSAGLGADPYTVSGGRVYLTGPTPAQGPNHVGQPFGLSIVTPVKAGPLDLENAPENHPACDCLVIRASIEVDPHTAQLTIASGTIPHIIDGIPLQIKHLSITIDRPGFIFNPTNCDPLALTSTFASDEGASANVSEPFPIANCASLPFKPSFSASTEGHAEALKGGAGASLNLRIASKRGPGAGGEEANLKRVDLTLPRLLPARLQPTLQNACTKAQFARNPAGCPPDSFVGMATVLTPMLGGVAGGGLGGQLTGPAIFVSRGGEALPDLDLVLQGHGVEIVLSGHTEVRGDGTHSKFDTFPDLPISSFALSLPQGPHSALASGLPTNKKSLCGQILRMPTTIEAQNGAVLKQTTRVGIEGCKPALYIRSTKVSGKSVTLTVTVPSAGKIVASGEGLSRQTERPAGEKLVRLKLTLTSAQAAKVAKRHKLKTRLKLVFTPRRGRKLTKTVAVSFG